MGTISDGPCLQESERQGKDCNCPQSPQMPQRPFRSQNYRSFQKNAKSVNPLVQVTSALTDVFPRVTDKTEGFSRKRLGVVSPNIKSLALNRVFVQPCQLQISQS